ncbi:MAG TPA: response regulator, partial [Vicinamibacteria bacterium]|nr:response regulator [Vicinamibacteria bacterium]
TPLTDEQREFAETARRSGELLLAAVNDLIDFTKPEASPPELASIPFDLRANLEEVGDLLALRAREKGLELAVLVDHRLPARLTGDPARLRRVLLGLGGQAVKRAARGELVLAAALAEGEGPRVRFELREDGEEPGAPTGSEPRGHASGLALGRRLVETMGGRCEVGGRTISWTIPFGEAEALEASPPPASVRGLRVLVVDDNATNRRVLTEMLRVWGCIFLEADSGVAALDRLEEAVAAGEPVSLALLDQEMPGMDGAELARAIKADSRLGRIALILMTSIPRRGDAREMAALGFAAYLTKPVRRSVLHDAIATAAEARRSGAPAPEAPVLITAHSIEERLRRKGRVLVVDDNAVNQTLVVKILEKAACRCDLAENGREAVKAARQGSYDLIFMDCEMPELDGLSATRLIREAEAPGRRLPIVAMTAETQPGDRERCLAAGMDDYLSVPLTPEDLYRMLELHLPRQPLAALAGGAPVDVMRVREASGGDADFEREIWQLFVEETAKDLAALDEALAGGDGRTAQRAAHTVKGAGKTIGAGDFSAVAARLESLAASELLEEVRSGVGELRQQYERICDFLVDSGRYGGAAAGGS